jgi:hypothetical protein
MPLSEPQKAIVSSTARWRVAACGRRFGKSFVGIRELARFAVPPNQKVWYLSPTYRQSKQIIWTPLKEKLLALRWVKKVNEQDLTLTLHNHSTISLRGADNPYSLRGVGLNFLVIDEAADVKQESWSQVLRPTLSDTNGSALFLGTPRSRNWFFDIWERGQNHEPDWASWQFTTLQGGNVAEAEIEAARRDLDELTFSAEYLADFVSFEGRAYPAFTRATHCSPLTYNPRAPLCFSFDWNVEPGVAVVSQEMVLPNGETGTGVVGEVWIPRSSSTPAVCRKLIQDWGHHRGPVYLFGDATGGARGSARVMGSDIDLMRNELRPAFGDRMQLRIPASNPPERVRINAVNSRLKSAAGVIKLMVDPVKAPHLVRDFEGTALLKGGSGELDKKSDPMLTHISDALGYMVAREYPIATYQTGMIPWTI